ncbi:RtcB family protein [Sandaracinobacteroides saxicola]|uniref:3'-phosphate/5'-hydroxy nucleic acid ligase n=1 Tax=Sandaracinobacteroides saxicola TaxID=2759707 RepID=A0A7G5IKE0_9SPHN|nr:RtcB family protein [Sandaracinobacteroides saxicola]QMW23832.1 RtcB family protein [Sandaracinobacteroides saxicola]
MTDHRYSVHETAGVPLKLWDSHGAFEDGAMAQLRNVASLPFVHSHVAGMPDVHWGMGATVGSVIATKAAIIPAAVGVDIGCGMMAVRTTALGRQLPDNLHAMRCAIEAAVPHGRTDNGGANDRGAWGEPPADALAVWAAIEDGYKAIIAKHPKAAAFNSARHLGSLGTGNHFIEVCLDEEDRLWVMLHSGSRGVGNRFGSYFIELAKKDMRRWFINLPDEDLAYFPEGTEHFADYWQAVSWAQGFAKANRELMMAAVLRAIAPFLPPFETVQEAVNCHHNYVSREAHFGENVMVTRKGAVRARAGELGIIPGSMGTGSFIVEGRGNPHSFQSCSHGAGRKMSRGAAKKAISLEQHADAMRGIEARLDAGVLDESPAAYKDIGAVMAAQADLVTIRHRLRQVVNVKG